MTRLHLAYALACLLAGAAAPAFAQTTAGVADPQAGAPATIYRPAIQPNAAAAPAATPDQAWRAANATVGGRNAMSLTMPGMGGTHDMGGHDMSGHDMHGAAPAAAGTGPRCGAGNDGGKGMQCMVAGADAAGMHAGHAGHTNMSMPAQAGKDTAGGMQCMAGDSGCCGKGCCGGNGAAGGHAHHPGMQMGAAAAGEQRMGGGGGKGCCCGEKCCCAGKAAGSDHAGHAGMAMNDGCCDHKEAQ